MILDMPDDVIDAVEEILSREDPYWRRKLAQEESNDYLEVSSI